MEPFIQNNFYNIHPRVSYSTPNFYDIASWDECCSLYFNYGDCYAYSWDLGLVPNSERVCTLFSIASGSFVPGVMPPPPSLAQSCPRGITTDSQMDLDNSEGIFRLGACDVTALPYYF